MSGEGRGLSPAPSAPARAYPAAFSSRSAVVMSGATIVASDSFNEDNDPSSALIGIYQYGPENTYTWVSEVSGEL